MLTHTPSGAFFIAFYYLSQRPILVKTYYPRLSCKENAKRVSEATENIDHTLLGQKCPWPRTLLALEFHYCPFSSASEPPIETQGLQKDENMENMPYPTLKHHSRDHTSINSIQRFCNWAQDLVPNTVGELNNHSIYLASTIYSTIRQKNE